MRDRRLVLFIEDSIGAKAFTRRRSAVLQASCWSRGVVTILLADMSPIAASAAARCSVGGDADQAVARVDDIGRRDDGVSEHRLQHREGVKEGRVANAAARELRPQPRRRGW
jgi:hypothetical protein